MRINNVMMWAVLLGLGCASSEAPPPEEARAAEEMPTPEMTTPMETPPPAPAAEPAAAAPAPAPDPLVAAPTMYKQVFEDSHVRVLEVAFKPGEAIPVHSHPDHVAYVLSAGKLSITPQGGAAQDFDMKKGESMFLPAQSHSAVNTGTTEVKVLVLELKPGVTWSAAATGEDPVTAGPKVYKLVSDTDRVRVMDITFAKKAKIKSHAHPDHVVYVMSGGKLTITPEGGAAQDFELEAGKAMFLPAQAHSAKNSGKTEVKAVVFEIKK